MGRDFGRNVDPIFARGLQVMAFCGFQLMGAPIQSNLCLKFSRDPRIHASNASRVRVVIECTENFVITRTRVFRSVCG